jgi:hypothetical protein
MKKCIAYRALARYARLEFSRSQWVPCEFAAADGSDFYKKHGDAVIGGVLGLWAAGLLERDVVQGLKMDGKIPRMKQCARRCKLPANGPEA